MNSIQKDTVRSVKWNTSTLIHISTWSHDEPENVSTEVAVKLSGTLTVGVALSAVFLTFVLSGITFNVMNPGGADGQTSFNFTYTGTQSAAFIHGLLVNGANITFHS